MSEYKRMILAVIVASIFIYLWTTFFAKPPARRAGAPGGAGDTTAVAETQTEESPAVPSQAPPIPPPSRGTQPSQERPAAGAEEALGGAWESVPPWERSVVETEVCKGAVVSDGGGLSRWELKEFPNQVEEPVNLVNIDDAAGDPRTSDLRIDLVSGDALLSFDEVPFGLRELHPDDPAVERKLQLTASDTAGASIVKTYTLYNDRYYFDLDVEVRGFATGQRLSCALSWNHGLPITERNEKADISNFAAMSLVGEEFIKDKMGGFRKEPMKTHEGNVIWTGVRNKYFVVAMVPTHEQGTAVRTWGSPDINLVATQLFVPMEITGESAAASFRVYAGPMDYDRLLELGVGLERDVYQRFKFMAPLNHLVFGLMRWTYSLVPNYGVVIILVSVLIKIVFYPLSRSSLKSMQAMKKIQPELEALKKKYKGDAKKMNQAQMELFRKHKVNPMGGCLPILVQMPIFFALYNVLVESVELRRAPFVLWINDLSAPETLFHIGTFPIHVLPLIMAVTQLVQPTMGPSTDPRQQMMKYIMPAFLLVIFYGLPSGLVLYWTVNNVMTALQQYLMNRSEKGKEEPVTTPPSKPARRKGKANNK